jgi:hypothetical protein
MRGRAEDCGAAGTRVEGRSVEGWVVVVFEGCLHDMSVGRKWLKEMRFEQIRRVTDRKSPLWRWIEMEIGSGVDRQCINI